MQAKTKEKIHANQSCKRYVMRFYCGAKTKKKEQEIATNTHSRTVVARAIRIPAQALRLRWSHKRTEAESLLRTIDAAPTVHFLNLLCSPCLVYSPCMLQLAAWQSLPNESALRTQSHLLDDQSGQVCKIPRWSDLGLPLQSQGLTLS